MHCWGEDGKMMDDTIFFFSLVVRGSCSFFFFLSIATSLPPVLHGIARALYNYIPDWLFISFLGFWLFVVMVGRSAHLAWSWS